MTTKKTTSSEPSAKKKTDVTDESSESKTKKKTTTTTAAKKPKKAEVAKKKITKTEDVGLDTRSHLARGPIVTPPNIKPIVVAPPPPKPVVAAPAPTPVVKPAATVAPAAAAVQASAAPVKPQETPKVAPPAEKTFKPSAPAQKPHAPHQKFQKPFPPQPFTPKQQQPEKPKSAPMVDLKKAISNQIKKSSTEQAAVSTKKKIQYNEMMTVKDFADALGVKVPDVIKKLLTLGTPASINQRLQAETAALLAEAFEFDFEVKSLYEEESAAVIQEDSENLVPRPPVVTVMGHVDHGKTSLLDAIRSARVAAGEAGGITQHIGAYQVKTDRGVITFLDTPGHEAFTAMRARGANATDLVILVVAADDSVMPQTIEAIDHAKAAEVPIVVAINKVDLPQANVQKVKQELAQHNLLAEDWGGKTVMVEVSAKTKLNIDKLLEMILLETELLELKANPNRPAKGVVLEAKMDPRRGVTATVLIQAGTLKVGDVVVCGVAQGRIRAMLDDRWKNVELVTPSSPVAILGLSSVPQVGDQLSVVNSEREAREIIERRKTNLAESAASRATHLSLEGLHSQIEEGKLQELKIILKADVQGSMQAILDSLGKVSTQNIHVKFVHAAVGNINESDILLAEAADAIVFGFNVKFEPSAEAEAKLAGVDVRTYKIIYEMLADVKAAMEGLLKPEEREAVKGRALVKTIFNSSKLGTIAGCIVEEGKMTRGQKARVVRKGQVIARGSLSSLKRFKDDVKDVEKGFECGLAVEGTRDYAPGDIVEVYVVEKHARRLDS